MNDEILVVGCGSIGERHLRCLQRTGRAKLTACDSNPTLLQRVARDYAVPAFESFAAALAARRYAGIVICTPAHTHLDLARAALRADAALLIEKPLSTGLDGTAELADEIQKSGKFVGVAYVYHFMPWVKAVRTSLQTGELGRPLHVSMVTGQHFPTFRPAYREIYYARRDMGGGAIQDALTHAANAVEWLVGPTTRVFCDASHQALEGVTVEDTVNVAARNGAVLVNYALNQFQAPNENTLQIHCEHGSVKFDGHEQRWSIHRRGAAGWEHHPGTPLERDEIFLAQSNGFLDGLHGQPTDLCTYGEAIQTLKFNLAALASAETGQAIDLR